MLVNVRQIGTFWSFICREVCQGETKNAETDDSIDIKMYTNMSENAYYLF